MKANEFIKKYGVEEAKKVLHCMDDASEFKTYMPGDTWDKPTLIDAVGLRRLVESYELVSSFGGIKRAKRILKKSYMSFSTMISVVWNDKPFQCTLEQLEQAILDVESCHVD